MEGTKYIGMDVHKDSISIAVLNSSGKLVMESIIETKAITILEFVHGLRGSLRCFYAARRSPRHLPMAGGAAHARRGQVSRSCCRASAANIVFLNCPV
jgi:hypothetical protein